MLVCAPGPALRICIRLRVLEADVVHSGGRGFSADVLELSLELGEAPEGLLLAVHLQQVVQLAAGAALPGQLGGDRDTGGGPGMVIPALGGRQRVPDGDE